MTDSIKTTVEAQRRADAESLEAELRGIIADAAEQYLDGTAEDIALFAHDLNRWLAHGLATRNMRIIESVERPSAASSRDSGAIARPGTLIPGPRRRRRDSSDDSARPRRSGSRIRWFPRNLRCRPPLASVPAASAPRAVPADE